MSSRRSLAEGERKRKNKLLPDEFTRTPTTQSAFFSNLAAGIRQDKNRRRFTYSCAGQIAFGSSAVKLLAISVTPAGTLAGGLFGSGWKRQQGLRQKRHRIDSNAVDA
jgi:hypothetical protein